MYTQYLNSENEDQEIIINQEFNFLRDLVLQVNDNHREKGRKRHRKKESKD